VNQINSYLKEQVLVKIVLKAVLNVWPMNYLFPLHLFVQHAHLTAIQNIFLIWEDVKNCVPRAKLLLLNLIKKQLNKFAKLVLLKNVLNVLIFMLTAFPLKFVLNVKKTLF
jgi:hypothetical protein